MTPHSDADAPSVDRGVLARLKRLDPNLRLTWHKHAFDPVSMRRIIAVRGVDPVTGERHGGPVLSPLWHLWRIDEVNDSKWHLVSTYPAFTDRQVLALERDLARFIAPKHIMRHITETQEAEKQRREAAFRDNQAQKTKANNRRIGDLIFNGYTGERETKTFSYAGQKSRTAASERGLVTDEGKAGGWEIE